MTEIVALPKRKISILVNDNDYVTIHSTDYATMTEIVDLLKRKMKYIHVILLAFRETDHRINQVSALITLYSRMLLPNLNLDIQLHCNAFQSILPVLTYY